MAHECLHHTSTATSYIFLASFSSGSCEQIIPMRFVAAEVGAFPLGPFVVPGAILELQSHGFQDTFRRQEISIGRGNETWRGASPRGIHIHNGRFGEESGRTQQEERAMETRTRENENHKMKSHGNQDLPSVLAKPSIGSFRNPRQFSG